MLTKRHLAVLQAALRFFDEEFVPHGLDVAKFYFEESLEPALTGEEITDLRAALSHCQVRYALSDSTGTRLISKRLVMDTDQLVRPASQQSALVVTVLCTISERA